MWATNRKFDPRFTSTQYTLTTLLSSTPLCSPQWPIDFRPKTAFVWCSQRFDARNKRRMHIAYNLDLADHTSHHTTPVPDPHQSTLRRMCRLYSAGLPPQCLVKLQFRYRLCIDTRIVPQPIMLGFRSQVCRLVKLKFRKCRNHRFRNSQLLPDLHLQRW